MFATQQTLLCTKNVESVGACAGALSPQAADYLAVAQLQLWHRLRVLFGRMRLQDACPIHDPGLKAASLGSAPPNSFVGVGWAVRRCADVAAVVPISSYFREQGVKGVAHASFAPTAAWTARAKTHSIRWCLPSVRLPLGATVADPVADFTTSACDFARVQAFFAVHL